MAGCPPEEEAEEEGVGEAAGPPAGAITPGALLAVGLDAPESGIAGRDADILLR